MKLLSVVVPCYNSQDYMKNCIESLLAGGERVEIIVIDDGSTDGTGAIADRYAGEYPDVVKAVHQPNGGHGAGINRGLAEATGKFFRVVDSDDKLADCFPAFLDLLEGAAADADLVITNYVYTYNGAKKDDPQKYAAFFPQDRVFLWDESKRFKVDRYLMIHSCTFRTETVRKSGMVLPEHIFYEDNLMICSILPYTEKLFYTDLDLYLYTIGREGQSVSEQVMTKRYKHNLIVAEAVFRCCRMDEVRAKSKKLYRMMFHEMRLLFGIASVYARRSDDPEADANLKKMWKNAYAYDRKYAKKIRRNLVWVLNVPGRFGRAVASAVYKFAHHVVKFN